MDESMDGADPAMAMLLEALGRLAAEDRSWWPAAARVARAEEVGAAFETHKVVWLDTIRDVVRDDAWRTNGAATAPAWLAHTCGLTQPDSVRQVRSAELMHKYDDTRTAVVNGEITSTALATLSRFERDRDKVYDDHEDALLEAAREFNATEFAQRMSQYAKQVDEILNPRDRTDADNTFEIHETFGGYHYSGFCSHERGARLKAALTEQMGPRRDGDTRKPSERRADALDEIISGKHKPAPASMDLIVTLETLQGLATPNNIRAEAHGQPIPFETLRRLACDCALGRIIMRGTSQVIDVGLKTRVIPKATMRALIARDGGCRFPGCNRHWSWCDAHHIRHWADDGPTDLSNLILLCRHHHTFTHERRWKVVLHEVDNTVDFIPP
jgi:hypothetical protein